MGVRIFSASEPITVAILDREARNMAWDHREESM